MRGKLNDKFRYDSICTSWISIIIFNNKIEMQRLKGLIISRVLIINIIIFQKLCTYFMKLFNVDSSMRR